MELILRNGIAIGLFTGSIIALTLIIIDLARTTTQKSLIILILITLIIITFKIIRYPSISLGFIGDRLKKIGL